MHSELHLLSDLLAARTQATQCQFSGVNNQHIILNKHHAIILFTSSTWVITNARVPAIINQPSFSRT
jgi:hypothetical protein